MKKILDSPELWDRAYRVGLDMRLLERKGYLDILSSGEETPEIDLRLWHEGMTI